MKGTVLTLLGLLLGAVSSFGGTETEFAVSTNYSSVRDPAVMLRRVGEKPASVQRIADAQSEVRGSRPTVAYTLVRVDGRFAELSVQPVFGRINGAQLYVSF
jgi:hypothetical protein